MKKTTFLPILGLIVAASALLTAFSVKKAFLSDTEVTFEEFLQQFPAQRLPYALDEQSLKARLDQYVVYVNKNTMEEPSFLPARLDWKYFKFLPDLQSEASFSRSPMQAEPLAMFTTGDNIAVLYSTTRSFQSGYGTYHISVFDKTGDQISSNMVGKVMPQSIVSAIISKSLQADLRNWRIDWKKEYEKNGMEGNKIKGLTYVDGQSIDLLKPTPKRQLRLGREQLAPPVIELGPAEVEGAKSK